MEEIPPPFGGDGPRAQVDRYSPNPYVAYLQETQTRPTLTDEPPPARFASGGDLPVFCASGVDPELLKHVPWNLRHAAAQTTDPAKVYAMIEQSEDPDSLQTAEGARALSEYRQRVWRWATAPPPGDTPMTAEEAEQIWGQQWPNRWPPPPTPKLWPRYAGRRRSATSCAPRS